MSETITPELCVIGAGAAGLSLAAIARAFGLSVALVEHGEMGGECLNRGCVPSKALLAAAARAQAFREAGRFGLTATEPSIDFGDVMRHVRGVVAAVAPNDSAERFTAMGAIVIRARARFLDARTVQAGETIIRARHFVLAVGSRPKLPPVEGLAEAKCLTSDTVFELTTLPRRLIILGAGPTGLELAQAFRRLGAAVTVFEPDRALSREDPELAEVVLTALRREGVEIRDGDVPARVASWRDGLRLTPMRGGCEGEPVEADAILAAAGRELDVAELGLDMARVQADARGILTDAGLRTTNPRIFAIGDCVGGPFAGLKLTTMASEHAAIVAKRVIFKLPAKVDGRAVPSVVFTDPEIASVGLSEAAARDRVLKIRVLRWPFADNDRARAEHATAGHVKVIADAGGSILGAGIVGRGAGELITPWTLAVKEGLSLAAFRDLPFPYPTFSESSKRAALGFYAGAADRGLVRGILRALRLLG